jgi:prepilin-type N-terminal cleavage/methylation domain-containing protein/prepilin-type processing-associated H-X9-DG protein
MCTTADRRRQSAFTLVELLVVIGIIALLISILLPALSSARRAAGAVKCATQLREIGNTFKIYALDNKNYYPPAQLNSFSTDPNYKYQIDGLDYPVAVGASYYGAYWFNFLNRYVSKNTIGINGGNLQSNADARKTVVWGCSAFDGYPPAAGTSSAFDVNPVQIGYCMNGYPTFDTNYPAVFGTNPPAAELSFNTAWRPGAAGGFFKQTIWGKHSSERMLIADGKIWLGYSGPVSATTGGVPRTDHMVPTQYGDVNQNVSSNESNVSMWRHGKLPAKQGDGFYNPNKSKVSYNVLYVDGHVNTETAPKVAYTSIRMKYPG